MIPTKYKLDENDSKVHVRMNASTKVRMNNNNYSFLNVSCIFLKMGLAPHTIHTIAGTSLYKHVWGIHHHGCLGCCSE